MVVLTAFGRDWPAWLAHATRPASDTEEEQRDRTVSQVRKAIADSGELAAGDVAVYAKGSYRHRTNVRGDADVDVAVEWRRTFCVHTWGETEGMGPAQFGYRRADSSRVIAPAQLRARVGRAMVRAFGASRVDLSGRHAIHIAEGATTLPADVVPCHQLRRYDTPSVYHVGSRLYPLGGGHIDNFPDQHYANGVAKNKATGGRYKDVVRCTKRLDEDLRSRGLIAEPVAGYAIECLLYNVPNDRFGNSRVMDDVIDTFLFLATGLGKPNVYLNWLEVCELTYLFQGDPRHSPQAARYLLMTALKQMEVL